MFPRFGRAFARPHGFVFHRPGFPGDVPGEGPGDGPGGDGPGPGFGRGRGFGPGRGGFGPGPGGGGPGGGRGFGVRRPLRFLMNALGLDENQANEIAKVFAALRLEREQAELDGRKSRAQLAELLEGETLDPAALEAATEAKVTAARRERDALVAAIQKFHALLNPAQRRAFATLLRTAPIEL